MLLKLTSAQGKLYEFDTYEELKEFGRSEIRFWRDVISKPTLEKNIRATINAGKIIAAWQYLLKHYAKTNKTGTAKFSIENEAYARNAIDVLRLNWLPKTSEATRHWIAIAEIDPEIAEAFLENHVINNRITPEAAAEQLAVDLLIGRKVKEGEQSAILAKLEKEEKALNRSLIRTQRLKRRIFENAQSHINEIIESKESALKELIDRRNALEKIYADTLRLEKPATYWQRKANNHGTRGMIFFVILALTLVIAATCLLAMFNIWLVADRNPATLGSIEGILIFITAISTLAFLSKVLAKVAFSEFHLQRDAEERVELAHLYLALSNDVGVDQGSRTIILQSLFSRAETGLISNESGPTMPGLSDLLSALKKG